MRSAYAPEISAGVITANMHWYATNARCGTVPCMLVSSMPDSPM